DRVALLASPVHDHQLARRERGHQRRVPRPDAEAALGSRQPHLVALGGEHALLGGPDLDGEGHAQPATVFRFSTASAMLPTMEKGRRRRLWCLPSSSCSKERMVSSSFTYLPFMPVNCSATAKGWLRKRCTLRARATVSLSSSDSSSIPRMAIMSCSSL